MKVQLKDGNFFIRWQYTDVPVLRRKNINGVVTDVEVGTTKQTTAIASANGETIAEASVKRFYLDTDDKDEARKQSLTRLLDKMYPIKKLKYSGEPDNSEIARLTAALKEENALNKEIRAIVWEAYLNRCIPCQKEDIAVVA